MSNDVYLEGRPRPLSTGLWTLFSWLRRDDRSDSSESVSSAGSDRTVASFAFLAPAHYQTATTPIVLPPSGPPTDSYKKRVHDRNVRLQYDQDITLHRKYGLIKSGDTSCGYDAFSLPPVRRTIGALSDRWNRDRRATSECFQRPAAHVPGKRRAPMPPVSVVPLSHHTSLTRRSTRKRRAPPPPVKVTEENKENIKTSQGNTFITQMNPQSLAENQKLRNNDVSMGCKPEKYSKKDGGSKNTKVKSEKNFLMQIFDNKKRNSGIDISSVKLLPSISELDKQAAEIIENCKLKRQTTIQSSAQSEHWICVSCLRKYNKSILNCAFCTAHQNYEGNSKASSSYTQTAINSPNSSSNNKNTAEEKQKLKEMLKEMKDSLPKRPKHDLNDSSIVKTVSSTARINSYPTEMPTLRVGCGSLNSAGNNTNTPLQSVPVSTRPTLGALTPSEKVKNAINLNNDAIKVKEHLQVVTNIDNSETVTRKRELSDECKNKHLHTPLRISSLLNPVYIPKEITSNQPGKINDLRTETRKSVLGAKSDNNSAASHIVRTKTTSTNTSDGRLDSQIGLPSTKNKVQIKSVLQRNVVKMPVIIEKPIVIEKSGLLRGNNLSDNEKNNTTDITKNNKILTTSPVKDQRVIKHNDENQYSKRRDLIHQLEQSIATGNERAAAEAASKLAQLRVSCSVLSFSSHILAQPSTSKSNNEIVVDKSQPEISITNENFRERQPHLSSSKETTPQKTNAASSTQTANANKTSKIISKSLLETNNQVPIENQNMTTIAVLVEDREATRGPVHLRINRQALMGDLRREAEITLGLPTHLQRWIVGRVLCINDNTPVISLAGQDFSAPFYLCVVESENKAEQIKQKRSLKDDANKVQTKDGDVYTELIQLEQKALVSNVEGFECEVCMETYLPGGGVVLRECVHIFCKECLSDVVRHCTEPNVPCPATACRGMLQEREIRALVTPQEYERWLARGLAAAESGTRNAFHCRTRDCKGWALCEPGVQKFPCPVCKHVNCITCQVIHDGETCEEHRTKLKQAAAGSAGPSENDDGTRTLLNSLIAKGEALECPECSAIITKKWGCDWVKCSACKTEICWVTRGRRWGPAGKGDTSDGCRCGVDGKRCHPSCGYCH